jgi:8-oxo-dGTP pyrophosphatase MutT (NUDIX family)
MAEIVQQAGAVTYRQTGAGIEFLLVRAKKNPEHWIFPKGHIEPGERAEDAAVRELLEEAGVAGELLEPLGAIEYPVGSRHYRVEHFLCRFLQQIDDGEGRERQWCSIERALDLLSFEQSRELIRTAAARLNRQAQT